MSATAVQEFVGVEVDSEHRVLRFDLTKPQVINVYAYDAAGKPKEYFLKVTGRGLVLV